METNTYVQYYQCQSGSGISDFGPLYYTPRFVQAGRGFANFFASLYGYLKPLITSGFNAVKKTAIKTGTKMLSEVGSRPLREILLEHGASAVNDLHQKFKNKFQEGEGMFTISKKGIKRRRLGNNSHSTSKIGAVSTGKNKKKKKKLKKDNNKKKLKQRVLDIFTKKNKA